MFTLVEAAKSIGISDQEIVTLKDQEPVFFKKIGKEFYIDAMNLEFLRSKMKIKSNKYLVCDDSFVNAMIYKMVA